MFEGFAILSLNSAITLHLYISALKGARGASHTMPLPPHFQLGCRGPIAPPPCSEISQISVIHTFSSVYLAIWTHFLVASSICNLPVSNDSIIRMFHNHSKCPDKRGQTLYRIFTNAFAHIGNNSAVVTNTYNGQAIL